MEGRGASKMLSLDIAASPRAARRRSGDLGSRPASAAATVERERERELQPTCVPAGPHCGPGLPSPTLAGRCRVAAAALALALLTFLALLWRRGAPPPQGRPATCTPADAATRARLFAKVQALPPFPQPLAADLLLAAGFHRTAAAASLQAAADPPSSPLSHWALAYALGPGANKAAVPDNDTPFPAFTPGNWSAARSAAGRAAAEAARRRGAGLDAFSARLITATSDVRYAPGSSPADPAGWAAAEAAFAADMEGLAGVRGLPPPAAAWALALAAEATAAPVQWASVDASGALVPAAAAALGLVGRALAADGANPLALHLAIHLTEPLAPASAAFAAARALGLAAADALAGPGPWADAPVPHLLHMAGHAFARAGRWADAVAAGRRALRADALLGAACVESYAVEHNAAALAHAANLGGDVEAAQAAAAFAAAAPDTAGPALLYAGDTREATLPVWRGVLFGDWASLRALPPLAPTSRGLCLAGGRAFAGAVRAWGRAMAAAAAVARADDPASRAALAAALAALDAAVASVPPEPVTAPGPAPGLYSCGHVPIARRLARLAAARVAVLDGKPGVASAALAALADEEAGDPYMEPPRSPFPARPCAGWAALKAGDVAGAERQFKGDLAERPAHARALVGLAAVSRARGDEGGAREAEAEAARSWAGRSLPPSACPAFSEAG